VVVEVIAAVIAAVMVEDETVIVVLCPEVVLVAIMIVEVVVVMVEETEIVVAVMAVVIVIAVLQAVVTMIAIAEEAEVEALGRDGQWGLTVGVPLQVVRPILVHAEIQVLVRVHQSDAGNTPLYKQLAEWFGQLQGRMVAEDREAGARILLFIEKLSVIRWHQQDPIVFLTSRNRLRPINTFQ
jgi:hypothetical protein